MADIPITLSETAKEKLLAMTAGKGDIAGVCLRIAKGKGCGGNEYRMDYLEGDVCADEYDRVAVSDDLSLYIPVEDSFMMFGMQIDYERDDLSNERFTYENSNEASRCGCGKSFSMEDAPAEEGDVSKSCDS